MRYGVLSLICATLVVASVCPKRGPDVVDTVAPILSTQRIYYDDGPGFTDSVRMVIRDPTTWQSVWAQATSNQPAPPARPYVDFDGQMILVVGAGRMQPGDQIHVDSAGVRADHFVVVVRTIVECEPFPAEAYPLEIVRVPRSDRPVEWIERRARAAHCRDE